VNDAVYIIRHAEKPEGAVQGVDLSGGADAESLTVRGWQRAGALASFFGSPAGLPAPNRIYASGPAKVHTAQGKVGSKSLRPYCTVSVLAAKLNPSLAPIEKFTKGQESALAAEVAKLTGITLICWQHEDIPTIAQALSGRRTGLPATWPGNRFDVVWRFVRDGDAWNFDQVCQRLLPGDGTEKIE